ncbi:small t antigen [Orca polyomavirus]|nr:small t antigen [Orca polyomavirus]
MDRALLKEEKLQLIKLLEISPGDYGILPLMKEAFKKACKKYHPDKGGNGPEMQQLNSLWDKFNSGLLNVTLDEVYITWFKPLLETSVGQHCGGEKFDLNFIKSPACLKGPNPFCSCIISQGLQRHQRLKKEGKKGILWGNCWCFTCFCIWYGVDPERHRTLVYYKLVIRNSPFLLIPINFGKYIFL